MVRVAGVTTVADEQTKGNEEQTCTCYDENFEAAHLVHDKAENRTGDDTCKRVERLNSSGSLDAKVEGDLEDSVEVIALHCPGKVEHARDTHGGPDGAVLHVVEGHKRVRSTEFPDDEYGDADEANNKRGNDLGVRPLALKTTSDGQGDEKQSEDGDEENDSDNVEKPEELNGKALETELLEG